MNEFRRRIMVSQGGGDTPIPDTAIDLGLPSGLLWAQGNIVPNGNSYKIGEETDYGAYVSWGNIVPHFSTSGGTFDDGYDFGTANEGQPYVSTPGYSLSANIPSYDAQHDAALALLGLPWSLPTKEDFKELYDNTDRQWATISGVSGWKFMKKTDHSVYVFFPAGGYGRSTVNDRGSNGYYWSSSINNTQGYAMWFTSSSVSPQYYPYRFNGLSVRPVLDIYYPGRQGAFVYDTRGKFYTADEWSAGIADGSLDNDDVVGVAVISGEHRFVIDKTDANSGNQITFGGYQKDLSNIGVVCSNDSSVASLDFDGAGNTTKIINDLSGYTDSYSITGAPAAEACRAAFNGTGYLGALGEWALVYDNKDAINSLLTLVGGTTLSTGVRYKTSTLNDANRYTWRFRMSNKAMEERNRYNEDLVRAFKAI